MNRFILVLALSIITNIINAQTGTDSVRARFETSAGAEIEVEGDVSSTNIMMKKLSVGSHIVTVRYGASFEKSYTVDITETGDNTFEFPIEGVINITVYPSDAYIYVDGISQGKGSATINLVGEHKIRIEGDYKEYFDETEEITVNPFENVERKYTLKKRPPRTYSMVLAQYSPNGFGAMIGVVKKWGAYFRMMSNFNSSEGEELWGSNTIADRNYGLGSYKSDKHSYQLITAGLMAKVHKNFYVYAGSGYGEYSEIFKFDSSIDSNNYYGETIQPYGSKGVALDLGVIFKWKALLVSVGYTRLFGDNYDKALSEFNVGIGFTIHKNSKRK